MIQESQPVVILVDENVGLEETRFLEESLERLSAASPETPVIVERASGAGEGGRSDAFSFTTSRAFALAERFAGARALLEAVPPQAGGPGRSAGMTVLGLSALVKALPEAGRLEAWVMPPHAFLEDLLKQRLRQMKSPPRLAVHRIRMLSEAPIGAAGVLVLPACRLEGRDDGAVRLRALPVIEGQRLAELACVASGELYPGAILSGGIAADADLERRLKAALAAQGASSSWRWTEPAPRHRLHALLEVEDEEYRNAAGPSLRRLLEEHAPWVAVGVLALLGLILDAAWLGLRVRRKTAEIEVLAAQRAEAVEQAAALEKASAVNQMSSIVAHEIRQPLTALRTYVGSLRRRLRRGGVEEEELLWALGSMKEEIERADGIVEHVRSYASSAGGVRVKTDVSALLAGELARDGGGGAQLEVEIEPGVRMEVEPLEMQLVVRNLVKNAREAAAGSPAPQVRVFWRREQRTGPEAVLRVEDNGPALQDAEFATLAKPLHTTKAHGLGLGLPIVRRIAEGYGGSLRFARLEGGGLSVEVRLPLDPALQPPAEPMEKMQ